MPAKFMWQIMVILWTINPNISILLYTWIGTVLVVLSTTIDVQACVRAMLILRILFTIPGSAEPAQELPRLLACLQIGRLTC